MDIIEQTASKSMENLRHVKAKGVISEEEFDKAKERLLGINP